MDCQTSDTKENNLPSDFVPPPTPLLKRIGYGTAYNLVSLMDCQTSDTKENNLPSDFVPPPTPLLKRIGYGTGKPTAMHLSLKGFLRTPEAHHEAHQSTISAVPQTAFVKWRKEFSPVGLSDRCIPEGITTKNHPILFLDQPPNTSG
ncbi:hypothetical protein J6590_074768 [Homalodisca vitripennis]|nr:hypothetical protein J6590_074768 [Homalodisca vitripennis]